ncbi:MAG TPA: amino acid adenylation domain-containing protein [Thermoanaerobaculia bacterium]
MAPVDTIVGFRLSPEQGHLWDLTSTGSLYCAQSHWRVEGELDEAQLRQAVRDVVLRHEILRTRFVARRGFKTPFQVIAERDEPRWRRVELPADEEARRRALESIAHEDGAEPFDLEHGPLLRLTLAAAAERRHVFLTLPSLAADVATLNHLVAEIGRSYLARLQGRTRHQEALQFADVSEALHELLEDDAAAAGRRFWNQRQPADSADVRILFERPRAGDFTPREHPFDLSVERVESILSRAQALEVRPESFLLACWRILLCRFSRRWDLPVGVAFDGRYCEQLADALGPFAKYLPLSEPLRKADRFRDTVRATAALLGEYREWQELCRGGTFSLPYLFEAYPTPAPVDLGAACLVPMELRSDPDRFKLKLCWTLRRGSPAVALRYDSALFSEDDARRIEAGFQAVIESACAHVDSRLDDLRIDSCEPPPPPPGRPIGTNVVRLFEDAAARFPGRPAVVCGARRWSYAELDARADGVARALRRRGLRAQEIVALCAERSVHLIAGLLGILKAGGAYLPLDPETPPQRLRELLRDAGVSRVVTDETLSDLFADLGTENLHLTVPEVGSGKSEPAVEAAPDSLSLAYVIYTSGSTGRPKAVAITHQGLAQYAQTIRELLDLGADGAAPAMSFAAVSTIAADLGNTSVFVSLVSGGTLHLVEREVLAGAEAFASYVAEHRIDVLKIVPSHFAALAAAGNAGEVLPRKFLILGGEVFSPALRERLAQAAATPEVINHYGPTEATVGATTFRLRGADPELFTLAHSVPIGRPIAQAQALALDERFGPVPVGVPGELLIGGPGLARGYLGRPGETAERFVPHPYSAAPGARLYRTGDHVRYLPGHQLEILGRIDQQVKIRGFRVEPGEVAARLNAHPGVRQAVVVAHDAPPAAIRLVAYWVPAQDEPTVDALRRFLRATLPEFMVPASFVALDALPLTPNGKVDRRRLPAPDVARRHGERPFVAPRNSTEAMLADLWAEVLGVERIGVHDNFFELGGDSVYGIQIAARANQTGRLELSPMAIFRHPTIAELAAIAATARVPQSVDQAFGPAAEEVLRRISGQVGRAED